MSQVSIVEKTRQMFTEQNAFWSAELIRELDKQRHGLGFEWVLNCFNHLCAAMPEELAYLRTILIELNHENLSSDDLIKKAQQLEQNRDDDLFLALAHLFVARNCLQNDDHHYRNHLITTMRLLGNQELFRLSQLDYPLRSAQDLLGESHPNA